MKRLISKICRPSLWRFGRLSVAGVRTVCSATGIIQGKEDRYRGVRVDVGSLSSEEKQNFNHLLTNSLSAWKESGNSSVWLRVPIDLARLIPVAAQQGFTYHHADTDYAMLCKWLLDTPSKLPHYASHTIGVAGLVLNEEREEVLLVQDKNRKSRWKFPGGLANYAEDIGQTAQREVWEETGIKSEFQSVLAFREHHRRPDYFDRSDIYVVCRMKPLNFDISICQDEIVEGCWMDVHSLVESASMPPFTRRICQLLVYGMKRGFDQIDLKMEEMPSVIQGMSFKFYHNHLPEDY